MFIYLTASLLQTDGFCVHQDYTNYWTSEPFQSLEQCLTLCHLNNNKGFQRWLLMSAWGTTFDIMFTKAGHHLFVGIGMRESYMNNDAEPSQNRIQYNTNWGHTLRIFRPLSIILVCIEVPQSYRLPRHSQNESRKGGFNAHKRRELWPNLRAGVFVNSCGSNVHYPETSLYWTRSTVIANGITDVTDT